MVLTQNLNKERAADGLPKTATVGRPKNVKCPSPQTACQRHPLRLSPKMMSGSSSQRAARRKSRKGAMMPPKSHSPEQSDTPKFLRTEHRFT